MADIKLFLQSYSGQEDDQDDDVDGRNLFCIFGVGGFLVTFACRVC